jgi:hypothetical protein
MITPEKFKCKRCAKCCKKFTVKLSDKDIKRIKRLGYMDFFVEDNFDPKTGKFALKRENEQCIFLTEDNLCKIYEARPSICRKYPFNESEEIEDCDPEIILKNHQ